VFVELLVSRNGLADLNKLVADDFLFTPLLSDLVDEDDVVRLTDGQLGAVRRKFDGLVKTETAFTNGLAKNLSLNFGHFLTLIIKLNIFI
jgi:hypothetical protein